MQFGDILSLIKQVKICTLLLSRKNIIVLEDFKFKSPKTKLSSLEKLGLNDFVILILSDLIKIYIYLLKLSNQE